MTPFNRGLICLPLTKKMGKNFILFTDHLFKTFGRETGEMRKIEPLHPELPPVYVFIFKDYPDKNLTTFVTYGLSEVTHPKWHFGRPEIMLCVESDKDAWGIGLGAIVNQFRGQHLFSYGSTYLLDMPFVDESKMTGFVLYKAGLVNDGEGVFQLEDRTAYLIQAYPIYPGEAELIEKKGFEAFWTDERLEDVYDVKRKDISKK